MSELLQNVSELLQEIDQVSEEKRHPLGTRLVTGRYPYRYAQAGGDLKRGFPAFCHYEGEPAQDAKGHFIIGQEVTDALWGDIRPEGEKRELIGWPTVNVAKGLFFWLREIL